MADAIPAPPPTDDHLPVAPSPLHQTPSCQASRTPAPPPAPIHREQREKKESLKKRESNLHGPSASHPSSTLGKRKANASTAYPSPQRFNVPPPRAEDFKPPKEDIMISHEPYPFEMPDGERQLYKPIDLAENKKGYRYSRAIADPLFPHKQFYRSTSPPPHYARLSFEDADRWMHFSTNALITTNEKGWRMVRSNVCAREGTLYYEVKVHRGGAGDPGAAAAASPQPHVRFGFARREAPLDAPVGFDGYSYGITDIRFDTMHRSRPGKFFTPAKKTKAKGARALAANAPTPITLSSEDADVQEGDVIGLELQLPSLALHRKIVSGIYNPAVDIGDGFSAAPHSEPPDLTEDPEDIIRDRIPVPYKGNSYFEILDHVATKPMEIYSDRQTNLSNLGNALTNQATSNSAKDIIKTPPNPNHEMPALRTLPHSAMRVYKNGRLIGTAFENLLAFLPPASAPSKIQGAREGFDDGLVGYFPAVSCFWGGIAEVNFGDGVDGFWCPPAHLSSAKGERGYEPGARLRAIGERYKEQIAEDVVWDLVDEVDFFVQDDGKVERAGAAEAGLGGGRGGLKEED